MSTPLNQTHELSITSVPGHGVRLEIEDKAGHEQTIVVHLSVKEAKMLGDEAFKAACIAEEA